MMEQKTDTPAKLIRIPYSAINVHKLENLFVMLGENEIAAVDEVSNEDTEPVEDHDEVSSENTEPVEDHGQ